MDTTTVSSDGQKLSPKIVLTMMITVVVLWGLNIIMIKHLTNFFPPLALAGIRLSLAAASLLPVCIWRYGFVALPPSAWLSIGGVALFSIYIHQMALSWGITLTSATHSVLILNLNPLFTTLLASWFVREPLTWNKVLGALLGLGGILLTVLQKTDAAASSLLGDGGVLLATVAYVIGSLFVKKGTTAVPPLVITAYSHVVGAAALLLTGAGVNSVWIYDWALTPWPLTILIFSGIVNTGLGALWWNTGIHYIGASTASLFLNGQPIVGIFASALLLGEQLAWQHYVALLLVLAGVSLGTGTFERLRRPQPT